MVRLYSPSSGFGLIFALLIGLLSVSVSVSALQADLAGIVDWHKPLIGAPLLQPTPPVIVQTAPSNGDVNSSSGILTLTRKNVVALLDLADGGIVWRQQLEEDDPVVSFHLHEEDVLLLSGPGGSTARLLSLSTGHVKWERPLLHPAHSRLTTPVHLGTDVAFVDSSEGSKSVVVLSEGRRVTRLRLDDGAVMWSMEAPGAGDTILFKQLLVLGSSVHILGLHSSIASQTLITSTLDLSTSIPKGDLGQIPSIVQLPDQALIASSNVQGQAKAIWTEHGRIRTVSIQENGSIGATKDLMPGKGKVYDSIIDVGVRSKGIVLGRRSDGGVDVLSIAEGKKIDEFELSETSPDRSESVYSAAHTARGVLINRVYWSFNMAVGAAQTIHIPNIQSTDVITSGFTFNYDTIAHGVLLHAAVSSFLDDKQLPTLVLTTSNGAIQRMNLNSPGWVREESLADIRGVRFIELGEPEVEEVREVLAEEGFVGRLTRHIAEIKDLPGYLIRFAKRLTSASYTSAIKITPLNSTHLHRDQFGFQKLLVAVTGNGKLFALDSSNGATVWSRNLGLTSEKGAELDVQGLWTVRDGEGGREPMLAVLATKTVDDSVATVAFHIDAYTGRVAGEVDPTYHLSLGKTLFAGKPQSSFILPFQNCGTKAQVLAVVDDDETLHIFPSCKKVAASISEISDKIFYSATARSIDGTVLTGRIPSSATNGTSFNTAAVWSHPFSRDEILVDSRPVQFDAIASFGRVLGDKSTLYKYLNPHLTVISTFTASEEGVATPTGTGTGRVYVLDSTSGRVVYSTSIDGVVEKGGVKAAMVENWLIFTWLDQRGWKLGSVELYEETESKGVTPSQSSFEEQQIKAFSQTFILPMGVNSLGFTTSKAGITTKELIVVNHKNQVTSIHRRLLDPRRPVGKPSSRDKEEMLIPYEAMIPVGAKQVVSHSYEVLGAKYIVSSPALVESTSLLLAYGLDIFLTRGLTPSGTFDILSDSFNKAQLLLTLGVLSVGIFVAGPAVQRKGLKMKWY
ncbi:hypothetical protein I316_04366 [Kwoniella heveanensis BCC8398]|uniref:ER membrane protein complex subunit 1 n=1 Tax=Kwoniella heveanensis BCC8398 TaxID=1296120 RepID=A0A1B9GSG9_9TREE|nr:hypothetical protein I316_04366 [Kwoniella heveanensis BCC8398]